MIKAIQHIQNGYDQGDRQGHDDDALMFKEDIIESGDLSMNQ